MTKEALKAAAALNVRKAEARIIALAESLYANPEPAWEEHRSCARTSEELAAIGMDVESVYLGVETAFKATVGTGPTRIGLMAEYDALPGLGHACGHNIIAAASAGAAVALAPLVGDLGLTLSVFGTPAEEDTGGKIDLLERGAFADIDLAMMVHPAPVDIAEAAPLAVSTFRISYNGRAAHAAAYPDMGINAADAFTVAQVSLSLMRQQLPSDTFVHGTVHAAGTSPGVIPETSTGTWYVRASTLERLRQLQPRIVACFEAGALATGCAIDIEEVGRPFTELTTERTALDDYIRNASALGRSFGPDDARSRMRLASTDLGNVSQVVASIHPYIGVGSWPSVNHQAEFAAACTGSRAARAALDGATALAWTAIDRAVRQQHPSD